MKIIVVTQNFQECLKFHRHIDDLKWETSFTTGCFKQDRKTYDKLWYWWFCLDGTVAGSSGSGAMQSAMRQSGSDEIVTVERFVERGLWKISNDPYMDGIHEEFGQKGVEESGYFIDTTTSPSDFDYMLDVPCTPLATAVRNLKTANNPCVLISTGSFCPPHQGHIDMMESAKKVVEEEGVYDVIAGYLSPGHDDYISHKTGSGAIPVHKRIAMCEAMCEDWMSVDPWEGVFNKCGIMFTHVIERLELYLKRHLGRTIPVFFVCGSDSEEYVLTFRKKGYCVVVTRPGFPGRLWPGAKSHEGRIFYAHDGNNNMSSTEARKHSVIKVEKTNLTIRVEDVLFDSIGAPIEKLLIIVSDEYNDVFVKLLSKQREEFKDNISAIGSIVSLDAMIPAKHNLRLSRYYDTFGAKMLKFDRSPGADPLELQLSRIKDKNGTRGFYLFDDDIHTTGGTMRYVSGLLDGIGIKTNGVVSYKVSDDSEGEILDLRDFLVHGDNCGLVIQLPDGSGVRAPYVYPYVCPYARASITDPLGFSIKVWKYNKEFHKRAGTLVKDLGSMGELFSYAGMVESEEQPVHEVCEAHIQLLTKTK